MYVQAFEGAWIRHPFWRPRFLISTAADVARIQEADIPAVLIDLSKGAGPEEDAPHAPALAVTVPAMRPPFRSVSRPPSAASAAEAGDDKATALRVMKRSKKVMRHVFDGARLGKAIQSEAVMSVVEEISASVLRNPHALIGAARLRSRHDYTYLHSVAVCALMINLARELGLQEERVRDLGLAGLLHDIGKMAVSLEILDKPGPLDEEEFACIREHPAHGHRMLTQSEQVPEAALEVCLHHHEKMDGTGYPFGLAGEQLTLDARMGAICDVYDALTSNRAYKEAWHPVDALTAMAGWQGHFDRRLLFRFMQSLLIFPEGMLVRLRSNRLGLVLPTTKRVVVAPRVRAFYSTVDFAMLPVRDVSISNSLADDQIVSEEDPETWGLLGWESLRARLLGTGAKAA